MRALLPWILVLPLAACARGTDPGPATAEVPAGWRASSGAADANASWPGMEWWRGFRSPELNQLIDEARANSPDIQAAAAQVRQADAQITTAGASLLPSVSLGAEDQWSRASQRSRGLAGARTTETRSYQIAPTASWEIDLWGKLRAGKDAAVATALASRYNRDAVALTTVASVASAWFQALALRDRLDIASRDLSDAEQVLRAIQARRDAGTASLLDVSQQAALVANQRAQIPALRSQMEQQINALAVLIGHPPASITVRPGTLDALALPEITPGLPSALLARRPDIADAEAQLVAAQANIRAARAAFFPSITLSGSAGWQSTALATLFGPGAFFANAALSATQTIFDNGTLSAQLALDRAKFDELAANYRKTVMQAFTDVEDGMVAYQYATEQERLAREAVRVARQAADIALEQVRAGTSDMVTALQAQTTLFSDLDSLAQVRLARFQALLSLYKALGGGWSREDVEAPSVRLFQGVL